jgi:phage recombination protein Bet
MSNGTTKQTEIVKQDDKPFAVRYTPFGEKNEISLSVNDVTNFIAAKTKSGKVATAKDIILFMKLCQANGLNPWVRDAYLVGYDGNDGPTFTMITAHQSLLNRAELSSEFDGMESGVVIVRNGESEPQQRAGTIVLPGETIVGGWAIVYRRDRSRPICSTVLFSTYTTGMSRWKADPSGMIVKVAQGSALRQAFPSTLAQCYLREEFERDIEQGESQSSRRQSVTQQQPTRLVMTKELLKSKSDAIATLLSQRSESNEIQQEAQQQRDEMEDQEPERQPLTSTLRECDTMLQSAGIDSTDAESDAGPFSYLLPDGITIKIGNGLDEMKSRRGLAILDAMKAETPQIVREMIELAKVVKT